ncbi:MAG: hypothetical protein V7L14_26990 [Nostoc sp.]|uniref:hypothetical protein n=1 Tax=Nostoc sp. TaxID=1180 RepID=UPI002FFC1A83
MTIAFCFIFQILVFVIILPIIENRSGKKIHFNYRLLLPLMLFIPSLWIYIELIFLFRRGEIEYNASSFTLLNNFINVTHSSLQYNALLMIYVVLLPLIISASLYSKVKKFSFKTNLITQLILIMFVFLNFYLPYNIIDDRNKSIIIKKQEITQENAESQDLARKSYNSSILGKYKGYYTAIRDSAYGDLAIHSECQDVYGGSPGALSCKETEFFCMKIKTLYNNDVPPDYFEMLESAKSNCSRYGWY